MPASWDETHVVDSEIGDFVTTARRSGETWYVGSITDENDRDLDTPLSFLGSGRYVAEVYADAEGTTWKGNPLPIEVTKVLVRRSTAISESLVGGGGFAMRIRPATTAEIRSLPEYRSPRAELGRPSADISPSADQRSQVLDVDVSVTNSGSTVGAFGVQVSIDGRAAGAAEQVRLGAGRRRTLDLHIPAEQIPDRDFRVTVGVGGRPSAPAVTVAQPRSLAAAIRELRSSGALRPVAASTLQAAVGRSEAVLRRGDVNGRLLHLQQLRFALYAFDTTQVTPGAREQLDAILTIRLGSPEGLVELAAQLAGLRDAGSATGQLTKTLIGEVSAAADAAGISDTEALARHLDRMVTLVGSASSTDLTAEAAAEILVRIGALREPARVIEAETLTRLGAACLRTDHRNYTGTGFVACMKASGDGVRLVQPVTTEGAYDLTIRYANSMGSTRTMSVSSGGTTTTLDFVNLATWDVWAADRALPIRIDPADPLTIRLDTGDNGNINIDSLSLKPRLGVVVIPPAG